VPKFIEFRKELPETLVGKVQRKDLKEIEAKRRGEEV
jgi:acyl-coenzyme A synthetase/AMP-(fatty) acid ligase